MKDTAYLDTFIDSILSLPPKVRTNILNQAMLRSKDLNPYLFLWNEYNDMDSEDGQAIANTLDYYSLAID